MLESFSRKLSEAKGKWSAAGSHEDRTEKSKPATLEPTEAEMQQFEATLRQLILLKTKEYVYTFLDAQFPPAGMAKFEQDALDLLPQQRAILQKCWPGSQARKELDQTMQREVMESMSQGVVERVRATLREIEQLLVTLRQAELATDINLSTTPHTSGETQGSFLFKRDATAVDRTTGVHDVYTFSVASFSAPGFTPAVAVSPEKYGQESTDYTIRYDGDVPSSIEVAGLRIPLPKPHEITGQNYETKVLENDQLMSLVQHLRQLVASNPALASYRTDHFGSVQQTLDLSDYQTVVHNFTSEKLLLPRVEAGADFGVENAVSTPALARAVALAALRNHWPVNQIFLHGQHADLLEIKHLFQLPGNFATWEPLFVRGLQALQKLAEAAGSNEALAPNQVLASSEAVTTPQREVLSPGQRILLRISDMLEGLRGVAK